jgi:hypothetical protein
MRKKRPKAVTPLQCYISKIAKYKSLFARLPSIKLQRKCQNSTISSIQRLKGINYRKDRRSNLRRKSRRKLNRKS